MANRFETYYRKLNGRLTGDRVEIKFSGDPGATIFFEEAVVISDADAKLGRDGHVLKAAGTKKLLSYWKATGGVLKSETTPVEVKGFFFAYECPRMGSREVFEPLANVQEAKAFADGITRATRAHVTIQPGYIYRTT
jgi:hypothetical protein